MICRRAVVVVLDGLGLDVLGVGFGDDLVCFCMLRRGLQDMTGDQALIDGYVYSASMQTMREFAQRASQPCGVRRTGLRKSKPSGFAAITSVTANTAVAEIEPGAQGGQARVR